MKDQQTTSIWKRQFVPELSSIRFLRWLFSWRMIRRYLFCLACLVTLIALFYAVENWRGKRAWEKYKSELAAKGVNLDWHQLIPPPVPNDRNFAMTPFFAPLYDYNPEPLQPGQSRWKDTNAFNRTTHFGTDIKPEYIKWSEDKRTSLQDVSLDLKTSSTTPVDAVGASEILKYLEEYRPVLEEVRVASQRPYSRFNLNYDEENPAAILLPHLGVLKHMSQVLKMRAEAELATGKVDAAYEDINLILYLADSVQNEPTVISVLVRNIITKMALQVLWEGLAAHQWSDDQLKNFQARLEKQSLIKDFDRGLRAEVAAFGNQLFDYLRKHPSELPELFDQEGPKSFGKLFMLYPSGWFYQEQIAYHQTFVEKVLPCIDPENKRINPQSLDTASKYIDGLRESLFSTFWHHRIFSTLLIPSINKMFSKIALGQTDVDLAVIACALERFRLAHSEFPESLDVLAPDFINKIPRETINGEPFKYRRADNHQFVLYSVGWNQKDDGGQVVSSKDGKSLDPLQGDWVWPTYPAQ